MKNFIWIFGGSTTQGYICESGQSSSWPDEIFKLNKNFKFKNFAFSGANTDQQITLLLKEIINNQPKIILWANKFNITNIFGSKNYRNKKILNYEFSKSNQNKLLYKIKSIDKTFKAYFLTYSLLDKIIFRINTKLINKNLIKKINIEPTDTDLINAIKNYEINTIEAITVSKKFE